MNMRTGVIMILGFTGLTFAGPPSINLMRVNLLDNDIDITLADYASLIGDTFLLSSATSVNHDATDTGYLVAESLFLHRFVRAEVALAYMGQFGATVTTADGDVFHLTNKQVALQAGIVGQLSLGRWFDVYGRIGATGWRADLTLIGTPPEDPGKRSHIVNEDNEQGVDAYFGGGLLFNITDQLALDANWQETEIQGAKETVTGIGFAFRF